MKKDDLPEFSYLGQIVGREQINVEFKKFCLRSYLDILDDNEIKEIITSGKINDNLSLLISKSLQDYILYILPKYISTFSNSNINGRLIFGIDDNGIITGIPSVRCFCLDKIKLMVRKAIRDNLKSDLSDEEIFQNVNIQVKKLKIDSHIFEYDLDASDSLYQIYLNAHKDLKRQRKKFSDDYYAWYQELLVYSTRLQDLVNNNRTRMELRQYIIKRNLEQEKIDITDIINDLDSSKVIEIPDQFGLRWDLEINIDYKIFNISENLFNVSKKKTKHKNT